MSTDPAYYGASTFLRCPAAASADDADVAVLGIPFDVATSNRSGARFAPAAIRGASAQLAWGPPWPWSFDPRERLRVRDLGDCRWDYGRPEQMIPEVQARARAVLGVGARLLCLGGDHFVSYPLLKAYREARAEPLSLIQFDAHSDTWEDELAPNGGPRLDHGTHFGRAVAEGLIDPTRSIQLGIRTHNDRTLGFVQRDADRITADGVAATLATIRATVGTSPVYLTFDVDCLDPAFAPGTGTPVVGGLTTMTARALVRGLAGLDIVGADVVEVCPAYDTGQITALAAATLAYDMLCLFASVR